MQWARSLRSELVIKFQLVTGDLIYGYQWAVAGSVYIRLAGGCVPHRSTQCLGRNWRVVAGPEYHRAGVKDPQEPAYGGSFKRATMGQHQFTHPDQVLQVRKRMSTTLKHHPPINK